MRKIVLLTGIMLLSKASLRAQTASEDSMRKSSVMLPAATKKDSVLYQKAVLPPNIKAGPAIFYIKNDKPVNIPVVHTTASGN